MNPVLEADLLHRLLTGDPIAPAEICESFLPLLLADRRWAAGRAVDEHLIMEAALDALFAFVRAPERYDPTRLPLLSYLRMAAGRDLLNALARERKHALRRAPLDAVELQPPAWNGDQGDPDRSDDIAAEHLLRPLREQLPDPRDQEAMVLRLDGVRETAAYARIYQLEALPIAEQRRIVKRHKDRLDKVARRLGKRLADG